MKGNFKKSNYLKIILTLLIVCCAFMFSITKTYAYTYKYNEHERIIHEVEERIRAGDLPAWHDDYKGYTYYQTLYEKFSAEEHLLEYFASLSLQNLRGIMANYQEVDSRWFTTIASLDLDFRALTPNETIGIIQKDDMVYLIWTSEYIPNELLNLKSVTYTVNGVTRTLENAIIRGACEHWDGDSILGPTSNLVLENYLDVQLNITPILIIHSCDNYEKIGIGVQIDHQKEFTIDGWSAELDHIWGSADDDPTGYYNFSCNKKIDFNIGKKIEYGNEPVCQLATHCYTNITEAVAQSVYDVNFGGYKHYVYFNTDIPLDDVYRVDCSYELRADDSIWLKKMFSHPKNQTVTKSLTRDKHNGGFFNLSTYEGLSIGEFKSNIDEDVTYKYRLMLNYDESNWELLNILPVSEADYKRVQEFFVFRLDYLYKGEIINAPIEMDTIDGDTLKIYDRGLVADTTTSFWKYKENTYEVIDKTIEVTDKVSDGTKDVINNISDLITGEKSLKDTRIGKTILITGGVVGGIIILYFTFNMIRFVNGIFKRDESNKGCRK